MFCIRFNYRCSARNPIVPDSRLKSPAVMQVNKPVSRESGTALIYASSSSQSIKDMRPQRSALIDHWMHKVCAMIPCHTDPLHNPHGALVECGSDGNFLGKQKCYEPESHENPCSLACIASPPGGDRQAPSNFNAWLEWKALFVLGPIQSDSADKFSCLLRFERKQAKPIPLNLHLATLYEGIRFGR